MTSDLLLINTWGAEHPADVKTSFPMVFCWPFFHFCQHFRNKGITLQTKLPLQCRITDTGCTHLDKPHMKSPTLPSINWRTSFHHVILQLLRYSCLRKYSSGSAFQIITSIITSTLSRVNNRRIWIFSEDYSR